MITNSRKAIRMPKIFDNIENQFSTGLSEHLAAANRVDYCVGYFNLRGWGMVCDGINSLSGAEVRENNKNIHRYCRLLIGMTKTQKEELLEEFSNPEDILIDTDTAIVDAIDALNLPRYGLQQYYDDKAKNKLSKEETLILNNLSRAGKSVIGFCRTNLFKRLESCGYSFLLSVSRHILRTNYLLFYKRSTIYTR